MSHDQARDAIEAALQAGIGTIDWQAYPDPPTGGQPAAEAADEAIRAALTSLAETRTAEIAKLRTELHRTRQLLSSLTDLKPGDDGYCSGDLSFDGHHTSDYRKNGYVCVWCGTDPDEAPAEA